MNQMQGVAVAVWLMMSMFVIDVESSIDEKPQDVVAEFYTMYLSTHKGVLPVGEDLERISPFLSRRLYGLIVEAIEYREDWVKRHPDKPGLDGGPSLIHKPPFVDGDFFSSLFEAPMSFKIPRIAIGENDS